ncbi:MAG: hypothetical protein KBD01_10585 [Acidobacteria bacterium]|nr:hypothetical protein [Acidobacteriota bacterium]
MTIRQSFSVVAAAALAALAGGPAAAQEQAAAPSPPQEGSAASGGEFSGRILAGFRLSDIGGRKQKYRQHIGIDDGPSLFDLSFDLVPDQSLRSFADSVQLELNDFGGDPFESLRLRVRKFGAYDFSYSRRKSSYFYEDTILAPKDAATVDPTGRLSAGGDFHTFDFDRTQDTAELSLWVAERARLFFGFDRYERRGNSTTTLDIQRDEFEFDTPIDERRNEYRGGLEWSFDRVTVVLEERVQQFRSAGGLFLPGFSPGENTANLSTLDFLFLDQPRRYDAQQHIVRVRARPTGRLTLGASASLQDLDLDTDYSETQQGTTPAGLPFGVTIGGDGKISRDIEQYELDATYLVSDRLAITANARRQALDQDGRLRAIGDLDEDGTLSTLDLANSGEWSIDVAGLDLGLQYQFSARLVATAGLRWQTREVDLGTDTFEGPASVAGRDTDHSGFFADVSWRPLDRWRFVLDYEDDSYDDAFTNASASDHRRLRGRVQYGGDQGLFASLSHLAHRSENDESGWRSDRDQSRIDLGYRAGTFDVVLGYGTWNVDQRVDQRVLLIGDPPAHFTFPVAYETDSDFLNLDARWRISPAFTLGGEAWVYDSSGVWKQEQTDYRAFVEWAFLRNYLLHVGYRWLDYDEDTAGLYDAKVSSSDDDYDARIAEFALGYRW